MILLVKVPPPFIVVIQGPPGRDSGDSGRIRSGQPWDVAGVGKTTLIQSLVKHYAKPGDSGHGNGRQFRKIDAAHS